MVFIAITGILKALVAIVTLEIIVLHLPSSHARDTNSNSITWSTPEECARTCRDGEPPRYCYYHFTTEYYTTMNSACNLCRPRGTDNLFKQDCECVEADGFERGILTINRMIPGPSIQVCEGDKLVIDVKNKIEGVEVSLHWHGIFQKGYQYYDGVPFVTQCPIMSGTTFRYQYSADNAGTHFYHSHISVHKIDGQYGSLVVRQPASKDPHGSLYDEDLPAHVIVLSDWMHDVSINRFPGLLRTSPGHLPKNLLINGKGQWTDPSTNKTTDVKLMTFNVEPGKRYRFRLINSLSTVCPARFTIQGHSLLLIAQDGEPFQPVPAQTIVTTSGERVDFILTTNRSIGSYWIQVRGLGECEKRLIQQLAILRYNGGPEIPRTKSPEYNNGLRQGIVYNPPDNNCGVVRPNVVCDSQMKAVAPVEERLLKVNPDQRIILGFHFYDHNRTLGQFFRPEKYNNYIVGVAKDVLIGVMNDIAFEFPPVPPISQKLRSGITCNSSYKPEHCGTPCSCPQTYYIKKNAVVEVVVYDQSFQPGSYHPFHLHGYSFRVLMKGRLNKTITMNDISGLLRRNERNLQKEKYKLAPAKDTIVVPQSGYVVFRFIANNPGWWFFHCHFLWHTASGMNVIFKVGKDSDLPPVPKGFPQCYSWQPEPIWQSGDDDDDDDDDDYDYDYDYYNTYKNDY